MAALMILSLLAAARGQGPMICGPGGCRPATPALAAPALSRSWVVYPDNPDQAFLFEGGRCVGGYDLPTCVYRTWDGEDWGPPMDLPREAPAPPVESQAPAQELPTGVVISKLRGGERYEVNGRPTTREQCLSLLRQRRIEQLNDDSSKRHLTLVCRDGALRKRVAGDVDGGPLAKLRTRYRVQVYDASRNVDAVMLAPFKLDADPSFKEKGFAGYLEEPDQGGRAKLLSAVYGYGGPEAFEAWLREADPGYDPGKARPKVDPPKKSDDAAAPGARSFLLPAGGASLLALLLLRVFLAMKGAKSNAGTA